MRKKPNNYKPKEKKMVNDVKIKKVLIQARNCAVKSYLSEKKKMNRHNQQRSFGHCFIWVLMDGRKRFSRKIIETIGRVKGLSIEKVDAQRYSLTIDECYVPASIAEKGCDAAVKVIEKNIPNLKIFTHRFDD